MKIERAVREKTYTLTSIAGPSGSGKTYSALLYARGLVGPDGKIGFVDTENKRSRFYADVGGGFDVIDLDAPFTSARYVEAIKAFEKAGYTAIIIDSISHEWEGSGGVLEQAEAIEERTKRAGLHCWQKPKAGHKKLMNELLQTRAHLIFCCRVKEKVVQAKGRDGKTEIINEGFVVVQEKSFIYEMTVSMMLEEGTHVPLLQKCPGDLYPAFPQGNQITITNGKSVRDWSDKGEAIDEGFEDAKREGLLVAAKGMAALLEWWKALGREKQARLEKIKDTLKSVAKAHDQMIEDQMDAGGGDLGDRLQHARNRSESPAAEREGFSASHVQRETESVLRGETIDANTGELTPNTNPGAESPPPAAGDDEDGEATSSSTEPNDQTVSPDPAQTAEPASQQSSPEAEAGSVPLIPEKEIAILRKFASDALNTAKTLPSEEGMKKVMNRWWNGELVNVKSEAGIAAVKSIRLSVAAIMRNDGSVNFDVVLGEHANGLGCSVEELGG